MFAEMSYKLPFLPRKFVRYYWPTNCTWCNCKHQRRRFRNIQYKSHVFIHPYRCTLCPIAEQSGFDWHDLIEVDGLYRSLTYVIAPLLTPLNVSILRASIQYSKPFLFPLARANFGCFRRPRHTGVLLLFWQVETPPSCANQRRCS